jgi:hypothetical protein
MSELKLCQGPDCHTYHTQDRLKGTKPNKTYQTRRRSSFYYGGGNFCSWVCLNDWLSMYIEQALDHFGRTTEAKHLTEQNAWRKSYDWRDSTPGSDERHYYFINTITREQRPLTREQYNDTSYTINTGE